MVGDIMYISTVMEYYHIAEPKKVDELSDYEWALKFAILEDIRKKEASE